MKGNRQNVSTIEEGSATLRERRELVAGESLALPSGPKRELKAVPGYAGSTTHIAPPTKAISLYAPWAWALMYAGKDVENRSPRFPHHGGDAWGIGRVWVHCSLFPGRGPLKEDTNRFEDFADEIDAMTCMAFESGRDPLDGPLETLNERQLDLFRECDRLRGHIIGSIEVHAYRTPDDPPDSPWYVPGSLAIMVRDPMPLAKPVACKGALGWWTPPADVMAQLREPTHD